MDEPFELPVKYKGEVLHFPARFQQLGYRHRFTITVLGEEVLFEPDEEGRYRAFVAPEKASRHMDVGLLMAIAEVLENLAKE